ncbi:MAG: cation diffusion facilitator family transporter [Pseudomonadota bacterium]
MSVHHHHPAGSGHHHHHHGDTNERRVLIAMVLTGGFMIAEAIGGVVAGSLALLADAGHMLLDVVALALTYVGFRLSHRPADSRRSFGYQRVQILAAFTNGMTLIVLVVWIVVEAVERLLNPTPVDGALIVVIAALGFVVNIAAFVILSGGKTSNLNMRGAIAHVLSDLLGSAVAVVSGLVILWTGWIPIDAILSLVVSALIVRAAWGVVKASAHILLEGTPESLDVSALREGLVQAVSGVDDVHHVHVWSLTADDRLATLHVVIASGEHPDPIAKRVNDYLRATWGIDHVTVQIGYEPSTRGATKAETCCARVSSA